MSNEFLEELSKDVQFNRLKNAIDKTNLHCKDKFMLQNIVAQLEDVVNGIRND